MSTAAQPQLQDGSEGSPHRSWGTTSAPLVCGVHIDTRALCLGVVCPTVLCLPKAMLSGGKYDVFMKNKAFSTQALGAASSNSLPQLFHLNFKFRKLADSEPCCKEKISQPAQKSRLFLPNQEPVAHHPACPATGSSSIK